MLPPLHRFRKRVFSNVSHRQRVCSSVTRNLRFSELCDQRTDRWQIQKFTRPGDAHGLISLLIKMPARCVDGYEVIRARGERAFKKAIVRFVTNLRSSVSGWQSSQLSTISATNAGWSPRTSPYSSRIAGLAHASMRPARASSNTSAETLFFAGNVASFRTHVSRTTLKIRLRATQRARASLRFDKFDGSPLARASSAVRAMRARKHR